MTKSDLIDLIASRLMCTRPVAAELVEEMFARMQEALLDGEPLRLSGIATLRVQAVRARQNLFRQDTPRPPRGPRFRLVARPATPFKARLATMNSASINSTSANTATTAELAAPSPEDHHEPTSA